jgi:hypothetical protein
MIVLALKMLAVRPRFSPFSSTLESRDYKELV